MFPLAVMCLKLKSSVIVKDEPTIVPLELMFPLAVMFPVNL